MTTLPPFVERQNVYLRPGWLAKLTLTMAAVMCLEAAILLAYISAAHRTTVSRVDRNNDTLCRVLHDMGDHTLDTSDCAPR